MSSPAVQCRVALEHASFAFGSAIARAPCVVLMILVAIQAATIGLWVATVDETLPLETRIYKLWVEVGGRVEEELAYTDSRSDTGWNKETNLIMFTPKDMDRDQVTYEDVLTDEMLDDHVKVFEAIKKLRWEYNATGKNGTQDGIHTFSFTGQLDDGEFTELSLCDFVPFPVELIPAQYSSVVRKQTPCNRPTILDCFKEGGDFDFTIQNYLIVLDQNILEKYGLKGYKDLPSYKGLTPKQKLDIVAGGCNGYVQKMMKWKPAFIFGGTTYDSTGLNITDLKAFQVILPTAAPDSLVRKLKNEYGVTVEDLDTLITNFSMTLEKMIGVMNDRKEFKAARVETLVSGAFDRVIADFSSANTGLVALGYGLMIAFVVLSQISFRSAQNTVVQGLVGLGFVFMGNIFCLAVLVLNGIKMNATVMQVLPFLALGLGVDDLFVFLSVYKETVASHPGFNTKAMIGSVCRQAGISVTLTSVCNFAAFMMGTVIPLPAVRVFCVASATAVVVNYLSMVFAVPALLALKHRSSKLGLVADADTSKRGHEEEVADVHEFTNAYTKSSKKGFLHGFYIPMMQSRTVRIVGSIGFLLATLVGHILSQQVEDGLSIIDVVPWNTSIYRGVVELNANFLISPGVLMFRKIDYGNPTVQERMQEIISAVQSLEYVRDAECGWMDGMREHYAGIDENGTLGYINAPGKAFIEYVTNYTDPDKVTFLGTFESGMLSFGYDDDSLLDLTYCTFQVIGQDTTTKMVKALNDIRNVTDHMCTPGGVIDLCYPQGSIFTFWEQYVSLRSNFTLAVILCTVSIFVVCLVLLLNVQIALFVSIFSYSVVMQIFGALLPMGCKFSAIPAVSLIMSIGISVEFTAHLCTHFESANGGRLERMSEALHHMFVPIFEGGFSSFLGFVCLGISEFAFIKIYYFGIYLLVVVIGMINGLFFLPCLLSFVGPLAGATQQGVNEARRKSVAAHLVK